MNVCIFLPFFPAWRIIVQKLNHIKLTALCWVITFLVILPALLKDNQYSPYNKYLGASDNLTYQIKKYKDENTANYKSAQQYLSTHSESSIQDLSHWNPQAQIKVLVTILTKSRDDIERKDKYKPYYLTQTVASYAKLKRAYQNVRPITDIKLLLCDVDHNYNSEAVEMSKYAPLLKLNHDHGAQDNIFEQEKYDYMSCIEKSVTQNADFLLLAEDDSIPHNDLIQELDHLFTYRTPKLNNTFGYIKLFHPTRLNGFITADLNRLLEWLALASLLEHLTLAVIYLCRLHIETGYVWRFSRFLYFLLLLFAIGRLNISRIYDLSPHLHRLVPAPSCCTPALLFTPASASATVKYLRSVHCKKGFAKDTAMDLFGYKTGYHNWFFEPNLFTHIGVFTTRRSKPVNPKYVN